MAGIAIKGGRLNKTGEIYLTNCIEFIPTSSERIFTREEAARLLAAYRARRAAEKTTCPHCESDETRRLSADEWECWNPDCRRT